MTSAAPSRPSPWPAIMVTAPAMLVVGLWGLNRGSLWGDEAITSYAAHLSLRQLFHLLHNVDAVHGLYYLVLHVVVRLGGGSEVALRLPSVVGMVAAVALTTAIGVRLSSSLRVGVMAGLIMAATPFDSTYARDARSYALVFAAVMGASLALLHALHRERTAGGALGRWAAYAGLLTVAGYLNELSLLVVLAHACTLLATRTTRRGWARWTVSVTAACTLVAPLAYLSSTQSHAVQRIHRPRTSTLFELWQLCLGGASGVGWCLVGACALIGALPSGRSVPRRPDSIPVSFFALPLLVVAPLVLFLQSLYGKPLFVGRYLLFCEAGAALLAAAGADRIGRWAARSVTRRDRNGGVGARIAQRGRAAVLGWAPGVALVACVLLMQLGAQRSTRSPNGWSQNFAGAANYIAHRAQPGDAVVFVPHSFRWARLGYPTQYRRLDDVAPARSPQQAGSLNGINKTRSRVRRDVLAHSRVWLVGRPDRKNQFPSDENQLLVLEQHFTLVLDTFFSGVEVRRYDS